MAETKPGESDSALRAKNVAKMRTLCEKAFVKLMVGAKTTPIDSQWLVYVVLGKHLMAAANEIKMLATSVGTERFPAVFASLLEEIHKATRDGDSDGQPRLPVSDIER